MLISVFFFFFWYFFLGCLTNIYIYIYIPKMYTKSLLSWGYTFARILSTLTLRKFNLSSTLLTDTLFRLENWSRTLKSHYFFFLNWYPEGVISSKIRFPRSKFNASPLKFPVEVKLLWIGLASQVYADKLSSSFMRCFCSLKVKANFTTRPAFLSSIKDVLPILQQSMMSTCFNISVMMTV